MKKYLFIVLLVGVCLGQIIKVKVNKSTKVVLNSDRTWNLDKSIEVKTKDGKIAIIHPDKSWEFKDTFGIGKDVILLHNGAKYEGKYISKSDKGVTFKPEGMPSAQTIPSSMISEILLSDGAKIEISQKSEFQLKHEEKEPDLSNTIWKIGNYVDEFGDNIGKKYISTKAKGVFSNSATTNSALRVDFIIEDRIILQLYEYDNNHPVKALSSKEYKILLKVNDEKIKRPFYATNYTDRLRFSKTDSKKIREYLNRGGVMKFVIYETSGYSVSTYNFKLDKTDGFDIAWKVYNKK